MKKRIVVIFGGHSTEYDVSLQSAFSVLQNINRKHFEIATLISAEEYDDLSASAVAYRSGSISNELLCRIGARLPVITKLDVI